MKSVLTVVQGLYDAIFEDLCHLHPSIRTDLIRDRTRLRKAADSRGLPFYTMDLPSLAKWLQRSLDSGHIEDPRPRYAGARSGNDRRPLLLGSLYELVFDTDGTLRSTQDVSAIASLRQVFLAVKKLRLDCKQEYVDNAIDAFCETEESLPVCFPGTWDCNDPKWSRRTGHPIWGIDRLDRDQADMFGHPGNRSDLGFDPRWDEFRTFCGKFVSQLGFFDPSSIRPKHGPGAISEELGEFVKYDLPNWTDKLQAVFPYDWHAAPNQNYVPYVKFEEFPSRLLAVPKDQAGPRLIAAEPSAHQWIQQGIFRWIEERLKKTFLRDSIDFRDQHTSQMYALEGSRTREFATVDLKSASDRLTVRLVEAVFERNHTLLDALHASRTRTTRLPDGQLLLLRKFATQGSALTFPIQSIVFALIAIWAVRLTEKDGGSFDASLFAPDVRVFGDDIILPSNAYPVLVSLLETLLLKVNASKSYVNGYFRESCGMDAYAGVDVTPAYFREVYSPSPTSLESVVECSNNFHKKGLWNTADFIRRTVPTAEDRNLPVVGGDDGILGYFSFCGSFYGHLLSRWNEDYHREERRVLTTRSKVRRKHGLGYGGLTQFFHEEPDPLLPYSSGQPHQVVPRKGFDWVER